MNRTHLLFTVVLIITFLAACSGPKRSPDGNKVVFRYNESAGISSLDPAYARNNENIWAVNHLFNGLLQMDDDMRIKPCIAMDWEISEDGRTYTFFLRRDVYFHDDKVFKGGKGRKVTANDFVYSFLRIMDSKTASPGAWIFTNIDQSNPLHLGFEALEKYTLRIHLKEPFQPFLGLLTMKYCSVVPHEIVEAHGADFRKNPVGTGPFAFKMWKEGSKLVLVRNANYFEKDGEGNQLPYLDAVAVTFISDEEVEYLEFLQGKLDFLSGSNKNQAEFLTYEGELKAKYGDQFNILTEPYFNTEYLGILMDSTLPGAKNSPLLDKNIRKALSLGFNRADMIKYLRNNVGVPGHEGMIPNGMPPYKKGWVNGYSYDPDSARKLLALSGHPSGRGLEEIVLSTTSQYLTLCEFIASQWSELGVKVRIDISPAATNREMVALSRQPFFRKSWVADYPDGENYLSLFYSPNFSPSGPNYTHFNNKEFDELYEKARVEQDHEIRYGYYRQMESIIMEEAPVIVLYYDQVVRFVSKDVVGLTANPMNLLDLRRVTKE